jgi:sulfate transport system permease protein
MLLRRALLKRHSVLPGFDLALGFALLYISLIVLIPLSAAFLKTLELSWQQFVDATTTPRVLASYRLSFGASFLAAGVNAVFGLIVAWMLVRYSFPGKRIVDGLVDLPFALPTAVAGIALTAIWAENGTLGQTLPFKVSFSRPSACGSHWSSSACPSWCARCSRCLKT